MKPEQDNLIHVAIAVYDPSGTYSRHAGVMITSLFEHTKSPVIVHVLHDDTLTDINRDRFNRTAEKYGQKIDLINVEDYKNKFVNDAIVRRVCKRWTIGTLYRLFIPEILTELDKIIYLDCDIVVNLDIAELWDVDIGDNYLGGVQWGIKSLSLYKNFCMKLNKAPSVTDYINAGVLIMNLKKIRSLGNLFLIAANWFQRHIHSAMFADQDMLNSFFRNSIKFIDPKFNYFPQDEILPDKNLSKSIVHICGPFKPYREIYGLNYERFYWGTLFKSAWVDSCNGGGGDRRSRSKNRKFYGNFIANPPATPKNTSPRDAVFQKYYSARVA